MMPSLVLLAVAAFPAVKNAVQPPAPYGAVPSARQIAHADLETYAFVHFTVNTFTDREWGSGDEDPNVFQPDRFDADQIAGALRAGGMKGLILTCKHHDGFCLWPTTTTRHSVASSSWMSGKGDVVRSLSEACRRAGLKFGVYLSPWDRNNAAYGTPAYVDLYRRQLSELLTSYGPIFEVWHDGANGGTGYYGGANERRSIDPRSYYEWPETWAMVRRMQPAACIFSDVGPDLRWVGNESGYAGETCWETFSPVGPEGGAAAPGYSQSDLAITGTRNGRYWMQPECDVSIRPGWFWHQAENSKVKSPAELVDLYFKSVGRGAIFLLNVPPDRHGLIETEDAESLARFHEIIARTFERNLAADGRVVASNVRGNSRRYEAKNLLSPSRNRYWATDDDVRDPSVEIDLPGDRTFDVMRVREAIQLGQRVDAFAIDAWEAGNWREIGSATSIGTCRLIRLAEPVTTNKVRLRITSSPVCPALWGFGLFREFQAQPGGTRVSR